MSKRSGSVELLLVAVRRGDRQHDPCSRRDLDTAHPGRRDQLAVRDRDGALPAQRLVDGGLEQRTVGAQLLQGRGVGEQRVERAPDQVVGGLRSRRDQQAQEADHLLVAQALALDLRACEPADQVRPGLRAALLDDRAQVVREGSGGREGGRRIVGDGGQLHRPAAEGVVVLDREAQDLGEDAQRKGEGEGGDEVDASVGGEAVDQLVGDRRDDAPRSRP